MQKNKSLFEFDGKKYMSTKVAADFWELNRSTVAKYCKDKRINAFKDSSGKWCIPIDTIKPLSNDEIHKLLFLTLQLKNNPSLEIDYSTFTFDDSAVENVYQSLVFAKYIKPFSIKDKKRIPYEVVLTEKGINFVMSYKTKNIVSFSELLQKWLPIMISAGQLFVDIHQAS